MSDLDRRSLVKRADGFITAHVKEDLMMLHVEQGAYFALDPLGAEIWGLLEHPRGWRKSWRNCKRAMTFRPRSANATCWNFWGNC